ncbi:annexin d4 [Phtheirospermum japonicum]|uniref:Annexin d4 n=1 Tax=Phtheirospermum japonicum TaxID=374723 RepID=A0A830BZZ6_9LAMI|nr:annexin d4 [Phtheirospermum japonicum]
MAASDELGSLTRAFSGLGVDESALISILGKWHPEQRQSFRKGSSEFFFEDERQFERWDDRHILQLRHEFLRLKDAIVLWTMHPWERDARLLKESLHKGSQFNVLVEIASTRSSEELLGARRAYHSLFNHSVEEDVAFHVHGPERKLLVALLSSYRYEGPKVNEEIAKFEAKALSDAIKVGGEGLVENEEVVRILSTRSKLHLKAVYKHYKEISGNYLDEDVDGYSRLVKEAVQCLCAPQTYFIQVLDISLRYDADEISKEAVTRVIVTRADEDIKQIKEEYNNKYGVNLSKRIEDVANGNYRDFLLTLIARGD